MDFKTLSKTLSFKPKISLINVIKNQRFKKVHLVETYFRDILMDK